MTIVGSPHSVVAGVAGGVGAAVLLVETVVVPQTGSYMIALARSVNE